MKNFARALRHVWPYRRRLFVSFFCAFMAAIFWGLNFTSFYPALKLLNTEQSLHVWIDGRITNLQGELDELEQHINQLHERERLIEAKLPHQVAEKQLRDVTNELAKSEGKLESLRRSLYHSQVARKYIYKFLPTDCYQTLIWLVIAVIIGVVIKCFFEFAQEMLVGSVVNMSLFDLRNRFYDKAIHLDVKQFNDQGSSELMARFTNDVESLGTGVRTIFGRVIAEPLKVVSCVVLACYISWQLTVMFLVLVPIAAFVLLKVTRLMKQATRRVLEKMSSIYKILQETFQGIRIVKAFTMEPYERRRFCAATRDYYHKSMRVVFIDSLAGPLIEVLALVAIAAALLVGSYLVLYNQTHLWGIRLSSTPLDAETLMQLYILLAAVSDPVRKLSSVMTKIQSGCAASDRIFDYLDRQSQVKNNPNGPHLSPAPLGGGDGHKQGPFLEFRDVCFSYEPGRDILTNISLSIKEGETIALVGHNGCGKTTLAGLLPRFYDPEHGSILIEGHDMRLVNVRSLRQMMGIVTQNPILFDDTVFHNIAYGCRGADREQVEEAARRAFAHDFIVNELNQGYDTRVGEGGQGLSGGQRQKIALARAILRNPRLLILDEFTSNYDPNSEAEIHRAMKGFVKGRTTVLITHRLHTLEIADRIVVLEQGRIAAVGTHEELVKSCPSYQRLHDAHQQRLCA